MATRSGKKGCSYVAVHSLAPHATMVITTTGHTYQSQAPPALGS